MISKLKVFLIAVYCSIAPILAMDKAEQDKYKEMVYVNEVIFSSCSTNNSEKINNEISRFKAKYDKGQKYILPITDFCSRDRVYILKNIMDYKINKMPDEIINYYENNRTHANFINLCKDMESIFWKAEQDNDIYQIIDQVPTILQIGGYKYKFEIWATYSQPGNGKIYGLTLKDRADKYTSILKTLKEKYDVERYYNRLLEQRRIGTQFNSTTKGVHNQDTERFFNGLNLLFDYEIARRLIANDAYYRLPISFVIENLIKNLHDEKEVKYIYNAESKNTLFSGKTRETLLKNYMKDNIKIFENSIKNITKSFLYVDDINLEVIDATLKVGTAYLGRGTIDSSKLEFLSDSEGVS